MLQQPIDTSNPTHLSPLGGAVRRLAIVFLLAASAAFSQGSETPPLRLEPYTFETADGQAVEAELGHITVPENRRTPNGRSIELAFVRFAGTSETPGAPIVYLAGGPGGSGITTARYSRYPLFMALRAFGDVIAFDQRGTGLSGGQAMRCRETYQRPLDQPGDAESAAAVMAGAVRECAQRLTDEGFDLNGYTSRESAADLNDLRRALGAPKISLWGISYGTHLALATLKDYPEHIERVILAGVEGLDQTLKLPKDQQDLLTDIARQAAADEDIHRRLPDLLGSLQGILQRLGKKPVVVEVMHPATGLPMPVTVGPFDVQVALAGLLRGPSLFRFLPDLVARMEQGDFLPLAMQIAMESSGTPGSMMSLAMDCASGASPERRALIRQQAASTLLGDRINFPLPSLCEAVPVEPLPEAFRRPLRSAVPTLLISGTSDGRTPPHNAEDLLPGLTQAHHLVLEGAGHSDPLFLSSPEILSTMERFLSGQEVTSRRLQVPSPPLVTPRTLAQLSEDEQSPIAGTYRTRDGEELVILQAGSAWLLMSGRRPQILRPESATRLFVELEHRVIELRLDDQQQVIGLQSIDLDSGATVVADKL